MPIRWHTDDPDLLLQAIEFTARHVGFNPRLIEKDYFCSVILEYLGGSEADLTFRGGTSLAKVHGGFYRLSEDLDFSISSPLNLSRKGRGHRVDHLKHIVGNIRSHPPALRVIEPLRGANESTQYRAIVGYESLLDAHVEPMGIEVSLREPIWTTPLQGSVKTMLLNPITGQPLIGPFPVLCLSYRETMAEKLRAALTRREVAVRDFFDVDHAVRAGGLDVSDQALLDLLQRKLQAPGNAPVDLSPDRLGHLRQQLDSELRPVLRERDFAQFDLERAIETLHTVSRHLARYRA